MNNTDSMLARQFDSLQKRMAYETEDGEKAFEEFLYLSKQIEESRSHHGTFPFPPAQWKHELLSEDEILIILPLAQRDFHSYILLCQEASLTPDAYDMEGYPERIWEALDDKDCCFWAVRRKKDDLFLGFCGITGVTPLGWELSVMLEKNFRGMRYGGHVASLLIHGLKKRMKNDRKIKEKKIPLMSRVSVENKDCQHMLSALHYQPGGLVCGPVEDEDYITAYEKNHRMDVTEDMKNMAFKFGVSAESLLTHMLYYLF